MTPELPDRLAERTSDHLAEVLAGAGLDHRLTWQEIDRVLTVVVTWDYLADGRVRAIYEALDGAPKAELQPRSSRPRQRLAGSYR